MLKIVVVVYLIFGALAVLVDLALEPEGRKTLNQVFWELTFLLLLGLAWPVIVFKALHQSFKRIKK